MRDFALLEVAEQSYFYIERQFDTSDALIEIYFGLDQVYDFMQAHDVPTDGNAITVNLSSPNGATHMHIGFLAPRSHLHLADGTIHAAFTPSGLIAHSTLLGPYDNIGRLHDWITDFAANRGVELKHPNWQIYRNDLSMVHESKLITDCYYAAMA